ncbi:MAG: methionine--tRNA ligase [Saprospiraceae bacterium]|nr:methionine--tRNA ligase [Saprospiraceae bacterium]
MKSSKRYLLTSALPYANGALHLGHLAGAYLPADVYARYLRLRGRDIVFVCGSDEHGAAITMRAKKEGINPQEIIDKYHTLNKSTFEKLGISFDYYHRTSSDLHKQTAQEFFLKLYEQGDQFEEHTSAQYYDEEFDQFLADRYIKGTCPKCGYEEAYGDQCENCGSALSPTELINPVSTISGNNPVLRETKHWYFKLDKHEEWLREWIADGTINGKVHHDAKAWKKHVVGQCLSWLDSGLQPRSITRDLDWGIPVPLPDAEGKVLYVWFDAPIGYISATKQWALDNDKNWEDYWKGGDDLELIHFIGKDNIVFHCIVFPAMLQAHGEYNLPINVPANQFLNFEGQKFSKSRGWGIEQHEYLEAFRDFPNKEDALRYALIRNMPENRDSDFKWDEFIDFHDKELADNLGNFLNRISVLTVKYYEGAVPLAGSRWPAPLAEVGTLLDKWVEELEGFSFKAACQLVMEISSAGNTFLQDVSPWKIWKDDPENQQVKDCLFSCLQIAGLLSIIISPFTPATAEKIRTILGLPTLQNGDLELAIQSWKDQLPLLPSGHLIGEPEILFAKINNKKDTSLLAIVEKQKEQLQVILEEESQKEQAPLKELINFDDFSKLDLRTGTIISSEKVPKANKLLKLEVDLGFEKRTIVSGIAEYFEADKIVGKRVLLVANLAPRKLKGIESQGMILMAENEKGELGFVSPPEGWPEGFPVR